ncbi:MAG: acylneuraminate cytidylyltransferase family protein [Candidatus Omnitrophica bacterium]|nr:acylneuraminate cytidylyltransferase family protein [Candidatus Omnitrophota bacterium]
MAVKIKVLVPMRGHSERVPNKNIRDFCGRPLFHRIFDALLKVNCVEAIVVDTDSGKIKQLIKSGYPSVLLIDRPVRLSGDHVSMNKIIGHDISLLEGEHFLQTHSTNPLLMPATIEDAVKTYFASLKDGYDSLFSVTEHRARFYDDDFHPLNHDPRRLIRTQDLSPVYEENSNFYIFSRSSFENKGRRIGLKPYLYKMNRIEAIDIDEEEDFRMAESIFKSGVLKRQARVKNG